MEALVLLLLRVCNYVQPILAQLNFNIATVRSPHSLKLDAITEDAAEKREKGKGKSDAGVSYYFNKKMVIKNIRDRVHRQNTNLLDHLVVGTLLD